MFHIENVKFYSLPSTFLLIDSWVLPCDYKHNFLHKLNGALVLKINNQYGCPHSPEDDCVLHQGEEDQEHAGQQPHLGGSYRRVLVTAHLRLRLHLTFNCWNIDTHSFSKLFDMFEDRDFESFVRVAQELQIEWYNTALLFIVYVWYRGQDIELPNRVLCISESARGTDFW